MNVRNFACVQGEVLRQQLLMRYCGDCQPLDLLANESKNKSLARQCTALSALSPLDSVRGSLQLKRAGRTLHDVQVC